MTVFEMQQLFETMLQTQSPLYNDSDKPDTDTILRYFNHAQISYIKEKWLSANTFVERVVTLGGNLLDLGTLVTTTSLSIDGTVTSPFLYSKVIKATEDYWHVIKLVGEISRTKPYNIVASPVQFKPVNIEELDRYLTTLNNVPIILTPVYGLLTFSTKTDSEIVVLYDKYTTFSVTAGITKMIYLKKPKELNLDTDSTTLTTTCELAPYIHNELVKYAVSLFEQEKYKLASKKQDKEK